MKLWLDDIRPIPDNSYTLAHSVNEAKLLIEHADNVELIDIDHDLGEFAADGGDGIKLLDWLEETGKNCSIRLHTMNPVGRENMRAIIQRNGWAEIK